MDWPRGYGRRVPLCHGRLDGCRLGGRSDSPYEWKDAGDLGVPRPYTRYDYEWNWWDLYPINAWTFVPKALIQRGLTPTSAPMLSYGWGGSLDLFWAGAPYDNHIFYKRNSDGVWQDTFRDWIDENVEGLTSNDSLTSFYFSGNGRSLLYLTRPKAPYNIKFGVFRISGPT